MSSQDSGGAIPRYEDLDDTGLLAPLRARAADGDPVAQAIEVVAGKLNRLGKIVNRLADAEEETKRRRDRFDGGLKVVLGAIGLVGTACLAGIVWLVTVALTADREIPNLTSEVATLHAADEEARDALAEIRAVNSDTAATLRAIDARLARIERRLDAERD